MKFQLLRRVLGFRLQSSKLESRVCLPFSSFLLGRKSVLCSVSLHLESRCHASRQRRRSLFKTQGSRVLESLLHVSTRESLKPLSSQKKSPIPLPTTPKTKLFNMFSLLRLPARSLRLQPTIFNSFSTTATSFADPGRQSATDKLKSAATPESEKTVTQKGKEALDVSIL